MPVVRVPPDMELFYFVKYIFIFFIDNRNLSVKKNIILHSLQGRDPTKHIKLNHLIFKNKYRNPSINITFTNGSPHGGTHHEQHNSPHTKGITDRKQPSDDAMDFRDAVHDNADDRYGAAAIGSGGNNY